MKPLISSTDEAAALLYDGPAQLALSDGSYLDGGAEVSLAWRPRPRLCYHFRYYGADSVRLLRQLEHEALVLPEGELLLPPTAPRDLRPGTPTAETSATLDRYVSGEDNEFDRLLVHLVNFLDETHFLRGPLKLTFDRWSVQIDRLADSENQLDEVGGYAITHLLDISDRNGRNFSRQDCDLLLDELWYFLAFARGSLVGMAVPVGYHQGEAVWIEWSVTQVDDWRNRIRWLDATEFHLIGQVFEGWQKRIQEPFWRDVLHRAVRLFVHANEPDPIEITVIVAQSALELLAWATILVEERWLDPSDGNLSAAGKIRLLLRWAGIDPEVPTELVDLVGYAKADNRRHDGPATLTSIRNQLVHPPKKLDRKADWPAHDVLADAWRLSMEYVTLAILRLIDHNGNYGSYLHTEGRFTGQVKPVPWRSEIPGG